MARLCEVILFCLGSAMTLSRGSRLADGQRTYTVSLDIAGEPFGDESIDVIKNNFHLATVVEGQTLLLSGLHAGQRIMVIDSKHVGFCWYTAGTQTKSCSFSKWRATWASQEETKEEPAPVEKKLDWQVMVFVGGNVPPFEIQINNVTIKKETGLIDGNWWWMTNVTGAGVVVSMFVPSTNAECRYVVGKVKKTCDAEGWTTEFETARSKEYDPNETTEEPGWTVRVTVEGTGPGFEITADDVAFFEVPETSISLRKWEQVVEIDTEGTPVQIRFSDGTTIEHCTGEDPYTTNLKGYKMHFESIRRRVSEN